MTDDDFDFGDWTEIQGPTVAQLQAKLTDCLVVIDTAQSLLRTAASEIQKADIDDNLTGIPSYKWVINWSNDSK